MLFLKGNYERKLSFVNNERLITYNFGAQVSFKIRTPRQQAFAHSSLRIREFCAKNGMRVLPHPPYSPVNFFLFSKLKSVLKGQRFNTVAEIKEISLNELRAIQPEKLKRSFCQLKGRWQKCIDAC